MHVNGCLPKPKCLPFERGQFLLWHNNCRYKRKIFDLFKHVTVRISVSVRESFHCSEYDWVRTYWRHRSFSALRTARLRNRNIKVGGWVQKVMVMSLADCFQLLWLSWMWLISWLQYRNGRKARIKDSAVVESENQTFSQHFRFLGTFNTISSLSLRILQFLVDTELMFNLNRFFKNHPFWFLK